MGEEGDDSAALPRNADEPERRLRDQYETVVEMLSDPVFTTDRSGYLLSVNPAFTERFGYEPTGDRHVSDFLADEDVETVIGILQEMVSDPVEDIERRTIELDGITRDGHTRTFEASLAPLSKDGQFAGVAAVLRDVTTRKRREEVFTVMDRALRHNLRSNVNLITGYTEQLEDVVEEEYRSNLTHIRDAAEWIHKLGSSLRTLQTTINESFDDDETVGIQRIVEAAVEKVRPVDPDADISVHPSTQGELKAGAPVEYALENVIENAVVHNDSENPTVDVWVAHAPRDGWVDVHVEDDGPGIPSFERDVVFGDASIDQLQHGSGLGLWITYWVVEMFDGDLLIEDNDPRGSVVTLRLPLADAMA